MRVLSCRCQRKHADVYRVQFGAVRRMYYERGLHCPGGRLLCTGMLWSSRRTLRVPDLLL